MPAKTKRRPVGQPAVIRPVKHLLLRAVSSRGPSGVTPATFQLNQKTT